jgi:hypothetical protein
MTAATGPMAEVVADSTSQMTDADLTAIASYLKSLPGRNDSPAPVGADDSFMVAGQAIYRTNARPATPWTGAASRGCFPRSSIPRWFARATRRR